MRLGVGDRIVILSILPSEGDLATIRIVHDLRQALSFTEEEHKAFEIEVTDDGMKWEGGEVKEIPIGPRAHVLIAEALEALDKEEKLTEDFLDIWDKFVASPNGVPDGLVAVGKS